MLGLRQQGFFLCSKLKENKMDNYKDQSARVKMIDKSYKKAMDYQGREIYNELDMQHKAELEERRRKLSLLLNYMQQKKAIDVQRQQVYQQQQQVYQQQQQRNTTTNCYFIGNTLSCNSY